MQPKQRIMIKQNQFQKLRQFKSFSNVDEMNRHLNSHLKSPELKRNEKQFIKLLSQYSCFEYHTGVCWRKVSELAKELDLSERSISRYTARLVDLDILSIVETYTLTNDRKASQGANIYIINKCQSLEGTIEAESIEEEGGDSVYGKLNM